MSEQFILQIPENEFLDITDCLERTAAKTGFADGACIATVLSSSAALVFLEKGNRAVMEDLGKELNRVFTPRIDYESEEAPYQCSAMTKTAFLCSSKDIAIVDGKVETGPDRALYAVNFWGKDPIRLLVQCI